ncbi:SLATT domain-containing protein [Burkholderia cenocepacia]|uniref:SLATT domain-containing protein n=1 Tax=Burkholderia cenocepacia TaxID=95486 RepID=UPI0022EA6FD2|nr:SLATT domain-containing protein [Burkholderia cenocepacia]MDA3669508.1 SLATT domain-containing protein [Burkholderia cenocepacia]MDA3680956.1 SLATT domain-containing protein [Burkholderia cenocepacia]MDA3688472.1 SLATT domain-containing protein [Burkholderia cenocepacia]MDA3694713.1 SLATT domain-containing protein [Burkholderia cenocepacia]MDA3703333.1 SLATT domain-containing protein [Burkholderia cenocepacia]
MQKDALLKNIATAGYNVGFGAKKHFATFDLVDKTPGWIGFISTAFGIYALVFDSLSTKFLSATFVIIGIIALYITFYDAKKASYEAAGVELTKLFNRLRNLYRTVQSTTDPDISNYEKQLADIESTYYGLCISKQIAFSNWYAHYKFFWEHQIDWIDEQKNFSLIRDKIPLSLLAALFAIALIIIYCAFQAHIVCLVK